MMKEVYRNLLKYEVERSTVEVLTMDYDKPAIKLDCFEWWNVIHQVLMKFPNQKIVVRRHTISGQAAADQIYWYVKDEGLWHSRIVRVRPQEIETKFSVMFLNPKKYCTP